MDEVKILANKLAASINSDIVLFNADMERGLDRRFIRMCCRRKHRRDDVLFFVVTGGGDADAAYRIARFLQDKYQKVRVIVSGFCKSAGTLLALGAHELIFSHEGELGPLDVQLMKADDLWATSSGLTVMNALTALQNNAEEMFEKLALHIKSRSDGQVTFKTATDIATKLTGSLFGHIYQQVEVMHIGEAARAMNIATEYGERLNSHAGNLKEDALATLVAAYPSHSFVIDFKEAKSLFVNVRQASDEENALCDALGNVSRVPVPSDSLIVYLNDITDSTPTIQAGTTHDESSKEGRDDSPTQESNLEQSIGHSDKENSKSDGDGGGQVIPISSVKG